MRKIILASASKARRKLLRQVGLEFIVAKSDVKEARRLKRGCAALVKENALKKALDVAGRFDSGVVIAADTVVLVGNSIIGKPRDLKDAFKTLRLLSKQPQWVYSGVAIVDIDNKKVVEGFEKTKVFIYPLTDKQIRSYFKKVSPMDKAGSFDIQGLGSIFIDRIEGCFYNVVGLPLAKLAKLLKKIDIDVFS